MESGVVDLTAMAFGMILGARSIPRCGKRWDFQYDFAYESVILKGKLMMNSWMENGVHDFQKGILIFWAPALLRRVTKSSEVYLELLVIFCEYPYFLVASKHPYIQILTVSNWKSLGRAFRPQILAGVLYCVGSQLKS